MWKAIGSFLFGIIKMLLELWMKEGKKPKKVKPAGYNPELKNDMDYSLEGQLGLARCKHCQKPIERMDAQCTNPDCKDK